MIFGGHRSIPSELIIPFFLGSSGQNQYLFGKFSLIFSSYFSKVKSQIELSRSQ